MLEFFFKCSSCDFFAIRVPFCPFLRVKESIELFSGKETVWLFVVLFETDLLTFEAKSNRAFCFFWLLDFLREKSKSRKIRKVSKSYFLTFWVFFRKVTFWLFEFFFEKLLFDFLREKLLFDFLSFFFFRKVTFWLFARKVTFWLFTRKFIFWLFARKVAFWLFEFFFEKLLFDFLREKWLLDFLSVF